MDKYIKRSIIVEAVQWYPGMYIEGVVKGDNMGGTKNAPYYYIHTLEGPMQVSPGDWVIKGVNGELYPCKPDIFEKTYSPL